MSGKAFEVLHNLHRNKAGVFVPIKYTNATLRIENGLLIITHDGAHPGERVQTTIPLMHVAAIREPAETLQ